MVRLADLPEWEREHMLDKVSDIKRDGGFDGKPWVNGPPLRRRAKIT